MRVGVVGVGAMGTLHARGYSELDACDLVGVYDIDLERAREVAGRYQAHCFSELDALLGRVDAVTVAVPTPDHHLVGLRCLESTSITLHQNIFFTKTSIFRRLTFMIHNSLSL